MNTLFECTIKYNKVINGVTKKVSESYLVKAETVSEAETKLIEKMAPYLTDDYKVTKCNQLEATEVFMSDAVDASIYFKYKVAFITVNDNGEEKRTTNLFVVYDNSFKASLKLFEEEMKGSMMDWEIQSATATKILDLFE